MKRLFLPRLPLLLLVLLIASACVMPIQPAMPNSTDSISPPDAGLTSPPPAAAKVLAAFGDVLVTQEDVLLQGRLLGAILLMRIRSIVPNYPEQGMISDFFFEIAQDQSATLADAQVMMDGAVSRAIRYALVQDEFDRRGLELDGVSIQAWLDEESARHNSAYTSMQMVAAGEPMSEVLATPEYDPLIDDFPIVLAQANTNVDEFGFEARYWLMAEEIGKDMLRKQNTFPQAWVEEATLMVTPVEENYPRAVELRDRWAAGEDINDLQEDYPIFSVLPDTLVGPALIAKGEKVPGWVEAVFALAPGEISQPIDVGIGFAIVKMIEVVDDEPLTDVQAERVASSLFDAWLEDQMQQVDWQAILDNLE